VQYHELAESFARLERAIGGVEIDRRQLRRIQELVGHVDVGQQRFDARA